eukprot:scaffold247599_cov26-Tisochrysis_lutea.AAC.2
MPPRSHLPGGRQLLVATPREKRSAADPQAHLEPRPRVGCRRGVVHRNQSNFPRMLQWRVQNLVLPYGYLATRNRLICLPRQGAHDHLGPSRRGKCLWPKLPTQIAGSPSDGQQMTASRLPRHFSRWSSPARQPDPLGCHAAPSSGDAPLSSADGVVSIYFCLSPGTDSTLEDHQKGIRSAEYVFFGGAGATRAGVGRAELDLSEPGLPSSRPTAKPTPRISAGAT